MSSSPLLKSWIQPPQSNMRSLFISDLHLHAARPDLTRALLLFLDTHVLAPDTHALPCDALYILGDLFEAWIGDDAIPPDQQAVIEKLRAVSDSGVQLFFQHGNRDFLIGDAFARLTGCTLLPEQAIIQLPAGPALIMHGDQLCSDDVEYQALRKQLRNADWQQAFLTKTLPERLTIAQQLRSASKAKNAEKSSAIMDVNQACVEQTLDQAGIPLLIHGHTHRPACHQLPGGQRRIVLGDWDKTGWYLECTPQGEQLIEFQLTAD